MLAGSRESRLDRTLAVGLTREYCGRMYRASQHTATQACEGCGLKGDDVGCAFSDTVLGSCFASRRSDSEDVIFEEIE